MAQRKKTTYQHDYGSPSSGHKFRICGPPPTRAIPQGSAPSAPDDCMQRYAHLAARERCLSNDLMQLRADLTELYDVLAGEYGGHSGQYVSCCPCPAASTPPIQPESREGVPVTPQVRGLSNAYRDPASFRRLPCGCPEVSAPPPLTAKKTPAGISSWYGPHVSLSEYQDTISRTGLEILKASQQHREPLPSSRSRKHG